MSEPAVSAAEWWTAFALPSRQRTWEAVGAAVATRQDESAASRKALADAVRSFRKLADADQPASFAGLLKGFQDEVDALTRRAKAAEKELLSVLAEVLDAPDPVPCLSAAEEARLTSAHAAEESSRLRDEAARFAEEAKRLAQELAAASARAAAAEAAVADSSRLRSELDAAESELRKLTNQDITIRDLERRLGEFESVVDESVAARLTEREQQLRAAFESELEGVREAELAAEAHAAQLRVALAEATAARDEAQAQLFAVRRSGSGGVSSAVGHSSSVDSVYHSDGGVASGSSAVAAAASAAAAAELHLENGRLRSTVAALTAQLQQMAAHTQASQAEIGAADESEAGSAVSGDSLSAFPPVAPGAGGIGASLRAQLSAYQARLASLERDLSAALSAQSAALEEARRWQDRAETLRASSDRIAAAHEAALAERERELARCRGELLRRPTKAALAIARQRCRALSRLVEQLGLTQTAVLNQEVSDDPTASSVGDAGSSLAGASPSVSGLGEGAAGDEVKSEIDEAQAEAEAAAVFAGIPSALVHSISQLRSALGEEAARRAEAIAAAERSSASAAAAEAARAAAEERASRMEEALIARAVGASVSGSSGASHAAHAISIATAAAAAPGALSGEYQSGAATDGSGGAGSHEPSPASAPVEASALHLAAVLRSPGSGAGASSYSSCSVPSTPLGGGRSAATAATDAFSFSAMSGPAPADAVLVLHAQREKLRARVLELEEETQRHAAEALEARARAEKLLEDNVKLFAKIRFLEAYGQAHGQGRGHTGGRDYAHGQPTGGTDDRAAQANSAGDSTSQATPLPLVLAGLEGKSKASSGSAFSRSTASTAVASTLSAGVVADAEVEAPYRRLYMESHDPFTDFRRHEKQSQLERLSTAERITLTSSRFFLGSKLARNFLFAWVCVTHLLVFLMLWHFTHVSHGGCEPGAAIDSSARPGSSGAYGQQRFLPSALRGGANAGITSPA